MIKLNLPTEVYWIDLIPGRIRFQVKPLTKIIQAAARNYQRRRLSELNKEHEAIAATGGQVVDMPNMADPDIEAGVAELLYAQGLARHGIVDWEGVEDENGNPLPVSPEACDELMQLPYIGEAFIAQYQQKLVEMLLEGNASAPSPNGTLATGEGVSIAEGAAT